MLSRSCGIPREYVSCRAKVLCCVSQEKKWVDSRPWKHQRAQYCSTLHDSAQFLFKFSKARVIVSWIGLKVM